ncbi:hypothetical protein CRG98_020107 [Punica granatum]|nr:hypothetical protein CRG98_020107 [Punica granatum]
MLTVEDMQQELVCNVNIKHREEFDEEKEPDGMVLVGWSQPSSTEKKEENHRVSDVGTSNSSRPIAELNEDAEISTMEETDVVPTKKRKLSTASKNATSPSSSKVPADTDNHGKVEEIDDDDDDDDVVVMLDGNPDNTKTRRVV